MKPSCVVNDGQDHPVALAFLTLMDPLHPTRDPEEMLLRATALWGGRDDLWVFGYASLIARLYGETRFQEQRNERYVSGREAMLVELGKYGLGERDLVANINFFSKVVVDDDGTMGLAAGHAKAGQFVELRFEMDSLVLLHAGPHPLAAGGNWSPPAIGLQARGAPAPASDDPCRNRCPENARGFINTERLYS